MTLKKNITTYLLALAALATCFAHLGCGNSNSGLDIANSLRYSDPTVIIHDQADPDKLNPVISSSANATYIYNNIFQSLLSIDFESLEPVGQLAVGRPQITTIEDGEYKGGMSLTYEIRPEATWDNGTPITAEDYIFTIKSIKNPLVEAANIRPYMDFIDDIVVDPANPKKFTVYSKERYLLAEAFSGYLIMPPYIYDPKGLMKEFTIKQLNDPKQAEALKKNPKITEFASQFNSPKYSREAGSVVGSGPYEFTSWETGQKITLTRKANWWSDKVTPKVSQLNANPKTLVYKIVNDWTTALTAMKDEAMDVAYSVRATDFVDLQKNSNFTQLFSMHTPTFLAYEYIGINTKSPKLSDKRVRRALAHLLDCQEIIDVLLMGLGERLASFLHPQNPNYDKNLKLIDYNLDSARQLLAAAGWADSNGDGILDKTINGEVVPLKLSYKYNAGNDRRRNVGLMLQENARRAGIQIDVETREWTVFLDETKKRDFDLYCAGWVQSPIPDDPKQIWHTSSNTPDGANRVGFGNQESDKIIDEIRTTLDEAKRKELYIKLQEIIYDDQPYIFLFSPNERIIIHNRFKDAKAYTARPGFDQTNFIIPQAAAK